MTTATKTFSNWEDQMLESVRQSQGTAVKVVGTSIINGQKVMHQARPATVTWGVPIQQPIPTITRVDRDLMLAIRGKAGDCPIPRRRCDGFICVGDDVFTRWRPRRGPAWLLT